MEFKEILALHDEDEVKDEKTRKIKEKLNKKKETFA